MAEKIKVTVKMVPLEFSEGANFAREREVDVFFDDTGNDKLNGRVAISKACEQVDCNRLNYGFSTTIRR